MQHTFVCSDNVFFVPKMDLKLIYSSLPTHSTHLIKKTMVKDLPQCTKDSFSGSYNAVQVSVCYMEKRGILNVYLITSCVGHVRPFPTKCVLVNHA